MATKLISTSTLDSSASNDERILYDLDIQESSAKETTESSDNVRRALLFLLFQKKDIPIQILAVLATVLAALTPSISAILIGRVFDVLAKLAKGEYATIDDYMHAITISTMALLALGASTIPATWTTITSWMMIGERHGSKARELILHTYLKKEMDWYESNENGAGDLTQLNRCVEELRAGNSEATALTLENAVTIVALLGTSFYYSWSVTLVMLASAPIILILSLVFAKLVEKYTALENLESSKAAEIFDWSLSSAKLVRLFQTQMIEYEKFNDAVISCKNAFVRLSIVAGLNMGSLRFIMLCMFVQGFWFGSDQVRKGNVNAGVVLTCFTSCLMLGESFRSMLPQIITIQKGNVAIKRIQNFIQLRHSKVVDYRKENINKISIYPDSCHGDIKFKNVDFSYSTRQKKILKNVNLHFPKGEMTFVVGRSGSGKSTLANLLLNFYSPSSGRVEIDGFSVSDVNNDWLTDNITLVEQSCTLFNDTIKNNILMGNNNPEINGINEGAKVQGAIQLSLLQEVIRDLPDGLNTVIGYDGVQLSGGQQQRVAIARAKLRDTPILILDEFTSALDIVLRDLIVEAVKKWRAGKTTIILTHEYSQIHKDDYVYLMEDGEIAEFGYRRDLELKPNGIFQKLSALQESTVLETREKIDSFEDPVVSEEAPKQSEFLNKPGNRLSTQILSVLNPMSMFQEKDDYGVEISNPFLKRDIRRRNKRTLNADLEKGIVKDETENQKEDHKFEGDRPELTPIKQIIKRMFQTVQKKIILFLGILFSLLNGGVNPVFSYCFSKLLVGIVPKGGDSDVGQPGYLLKWSLIVIFLALFDGITTILKDFLLDYSSEIWVLALRRKVFSVISQQSMSWFTLKSNNASEINTLVLNDSRDLRNLVSQFLSIISTVIVLASLGLIWAFLKGWELSLVCISLIPLFVLVTSLYAGWLQASENDYKNAVADLEAQQYEIVKSIRTIKTLKLYDHFQKKFDDKKDVLLSVAKRRAFLTGFGVSITGALTFVAQGILLYYGMKLVGHKTYTVQQLMETFTLLLFSLMSCAQLMNSIPEVSRGQRAGSYIFRILELLPSDTETAGNKTPTEGYDALLEFKNVSFAYPTMPSQKVLKDVSFKIANNEHIAIIGESGSGKSTISLLITRLFEFQKDSVFFQNVDINEMNVSWLRSKVALVDQKASFFDGTIYENLTYGLSKSNESKVIEYLKLANVYDFVQSLPGGLNTRIDTSLISGGQAQRLSIARALLRDPKLLILDECTSALDSESSRKIAELIQNDLKGITVMMITHSEDIMKISDRILTMKDGCLVEEGSFNELLSQKGELFRIVTGGLQG